MKSVQLVTRCVTLSINTSAQAALFVDKTFENCLETYICKTYDVKFGLMIDNRGRPWVTIIGRLADVDKTQEELLTLLPSFRTKIFDETTGQQLSPFFL